MSTSRPHRGRISNRKSNELNTRGREQSIVISLDFALNTISSFVDWLCTHRKLQMVIRIAF
jgi:hypothetical protein